MPSIFLVLIQYIQTRFVLLPHFTSDRYKKSRVSGLHSSTQASHKG